MFFLLPGIPLENVFFSREQVKIKMNHFNGLLAELANSVPLFHHLVYFRPQKLHNTGKLLCLDD